MNFAGAGQVVPGSGRRLLFSTHDAAELHAGGGVALPPLAGALVEGTPVPARRRPAAGAAL
jgi:hypothetical protein